MFVSFTHCLLLLECWPFVQAAKPDFLLYFIKKCQTCITIQIEILIQIDCPDIKYIFIKNFYISYKQSVWSLEHPANIFSSCVWEHRLSLKARHELWHETESTILHRAAYMRVGNFKDTTILTQHHRSNTVLALSDHLGYAAIFITIMHVQFLCMLPLGGTTLPLQK